MLRRIPLIALALLLGSGAAFSEDYFPTPDSAGGWRALDGADAVRSRAGMELAKLDYAFDYAQRTSQHGGLLVVRHGWLAYERYYGRGHREAIPATASVGKTYTSIGAGIMLAEKRAAIPEGLETKVFNEKYLPEAMPLDDPRKADITLGQSFPCPPGSMARAATRAS